jgi:hypothetical protein
MMVGRFFVEKRVQYAAESSFSKGGEVMCRVIASLWLSKVESLEGSVIHDRWGIATVYTQTIFPCSSLRLNLVQGRRVPVGSRFSACP